MSDNQGYLTPEEQELLSSVQASGTPRNTTLVDENGVQQNTVKQESTPDQGKDEWLPNTTVMLNGREVHGKQKNIVTIGAVAVFIVVLAIFSIVLGILSASGAFVN